MIEFKIGGKWVGREHPCYIVAEIGGNHNGQLSIAMQLMKEMADAGVDAVKFQKRTPGLCVPRDQWNIERDTPWGRMRYIEYRNRMEFWTSEYDAIDKYAKKLGLAWFASVWDKAAAAFMVRNYHTPALKIPSAKITDIDLLRECRLHANAYNIPIIMSTGMSTKNEVYAAICALLDPLYIDQDKIDPVDLAILHCNSSYPASIDELDLRTIRSLTANYGSEAVIGYSGHEVGLATTVAAVAMGAKIVERHVTLDRSMQGTDHAASVEPQGMRRLVKDIRAVEQAMGDYGTRVYDSEMAARKKLRGS